MRLKAFKQIPKEKMKHYHKYFDEYKHVRKFVDYIKTLKLGNLWVDNQKKPTTLFYQQPWINIITGNSSHPNIDELFSLVPSNELILYPNQEWKTAIHNKWEDALVEIKRRTFGESTIEISKLRTIIETLPKGFSLERIDQESAKYIEENLFPFPSRCFGSVDNYVEKGLGFCIKHGDKVVSHAGSFLPFTGHLEIQVDTIVDYRRRGLGSIVCAKLMEYCYLNDIIPLWDAHTNASTMMAKKLGYRDPKEYLCYVRF